MKHRMIIELNALAMQAGASWRLVRESRHLVVDFTAADRTVRRVMSATPSDRRALANVAADLRRALRRREFGLKNAVINSNPQAKQSVEEILVAIAI